MNSLLVVDDEPIMRKAILSMIDQFVPEIDAVYEAESGKRAIEISEQKRPDIICMDIKMPGVDGTTAIREIRKSVPDAVIIIISAFDEFQTAAAMMQLGIKTYLLKPLDRSEFLRAINAALEEKELLKNKRQSELELHECVSELQDVLENEITYAFIMGDDARLVRLQYFDKVNEFSNGGVALIIRLFSETGEAYMMKSLYSRLSHRMRHYVDKQGGGIVSNIFEDRIIIFLYNASGDTNYEQWLDERIAAITALVEKKDSIEINIGIGPYVESLQELNTSYYFASQASRKEPSDEVQVIRYESDFFETTYKYPLELEKEIYKAIECEDVTAALEAYESLFAHIVTYAHGKNRFIYNQLLIFDIGLVRYRLEKHLDNMAHRSLQEMDDTVAMNKWSQYCIEQTIDDLNSMKETFSNNLIEDAILFIKENYSALISLDDISQKVNLSSFYFTKLFKAKTGQTFVEYLTNYRMDVAKDLLRNHLDLKIKDICSMVGYSDYKYFCKRFRSCTGETPAGYRDHIDRSEPLH